MTTPQMLSLFIMPVGGLLIAVVALYVTRPKSEDKNHPRHTH